MNDRKSDPLNSTIHYIIPDIIENGFQDNHQKILDLLVSKGSNINGISMTGETPLFAYIYGSKIVDSHVLRAFFNKGALISTKQEYNILSNRLLIEGSNLLITPLSQKKEFLYKNKAPNPRAVTYLIATIFKERIYNLRHDYSNLLCCFAELNKNLNAQKVPKPLVHIIIGMTIQEAGSLIDIKNSIIKKEMAAIEKKAAEKKFIRSACSKKLKRLQNLKRCSL